MSKRRAALKRALVLTATAAVLTACFQVETRPVSNRSLICSTSSRTLAKKLSISAEQVSESCQQVSQYQCRHRLFAPGAPQGSSVEQECVSLNGEKACFSVQTLSFNTASAARLDDTDASALEAGGEYNRHEYSCVHSGLKDGDSFLVRGDSDSLEGALKAAMGSCS